MSAKKRRPKTAQPGGDGCSPPANESHSAARSDLLPGYKEISFIDPSYSDRPRVTMLVLEGEPPPEPQPLRFETVVALRKAIRTRQRGWIEDRTAGHVSLLPNARVRELWDAARLMEGAPPLPQMPDPLPGPVQDVEQALFALDLLLKWCDHADAMIEDEAAKADQRRRSSKPAASDQPQGDEPATDAGRAHAFLSPRDLATKHGINAENLRKRLNRWRYAHDSGYIEASNLGPRSSRYLYSETAVQPVIESMKRGRQTSGEK